MASRRTGLPRRLRRTCSLQTCLNSKLDYTQSRATLKGRAGTKVDCIRHSEMAASTVCGRLVDWPSGGSERNMQHSEKALQIWGDNWITPEKRAWSPILQLNKRRRLLGK